ncbi:MAG: putative distant relative of cell wall-associated hydrolase (modular protein) [Promethearchaeota archaeon]|nr:MAG: putative distant relative of cell wall-associated hydrolase (modular protein) [Candidatus Lokiarchaeota archaeon]
MEKNIKLGLLIFAITVGALISISLIATITPSESEEPEINYSLLGLLYQSGPLFSGDGNELDFSLLEPGDIIVTKGYPFTFLLSSWTHALLYAGNGMVVEATYSGVLFSDLEIVHDYDACAIIRVDTTREIKDAAISFAKAQFGKTYDPRLNPLQGYKSEYEDGYYSSELVWAAYKINNVDIDASPIWDASFGLNVAPDEIVYDDNTFLVSYSD